MKYKSFTRESLLELEKIYRLNMINSISGFKPANLIGTKSVDGQTNLAIFSSLVHIGSNPALLAFIMRPTTVERHTYDNIRESGYYTINHVPSNRTDMAHYSSAKFPADQSEFEACGFSEEYISDFIPPFVQDSPVRMGMKFVEEIPIKVNGTIMMIGQVQHLHVREEALDQDGALDLEQAGTAALSGLNSYYSAKRLAKYPYARLGQPSKNELK